VFSSAVEKHCKYMTIILHVFLYECEIRSLILGEDHKLRVLEDKMMSRILRLERD
jgi:hypothetical protein